jgi:hypothetical protein
MKILDTKSGKLKFEIICTTSEEILFEEIILNGKNAYLHKNFT